MSGIMNPTGEWVRMRSYIDKRIETLRDHLENPPSGAVFEQTRGRIQELRDMIEAVEKKPPEIESVSYFPTSQKPA